MAKEEKKDTELTEAWVEVGKLLLQEKQQQAMMQQLIPKINEAIMKVQELTSKE